MISFSVRLASYSLTWKTIKPAKGNYTMTKQISKTPYEDMIEEKLLTLLEKLWKEYHINNTSKKDQ